MRRVVSGLLLAACAAGAGLPAAARESACPDRFEAWATETVAEAGQAWRGRVLGVGPGLVFMDEVVVDLVAPRLTPEESRWFDAPDGLLARAVTQREWTFTGADAEAICADLPDGIRALSEYTRPRCFTLEGGAKRVVIQTDPELVSSIDRGTTALGAGVRPGEPGECVAVESEQAIPELGEPPALPDGFLLRLADLLDDVAERPALERRGFAAIPGLRNDMLALDAMAGDAVPAELPPAWVVAAAVAPEDYAEGLLLEHIDDDTGIALFLLADLAGPTSVRSLRLVADGRMVASPDEAVPPALRALLRADPQAARQAAVPALARPATRRGALGVLALSDPDVAAAVEELDTADAEELRQAAETTLEALAATAPDEALRELARAALEAGLD